ncbi:glycosyl hydrolase family 18 protein [Chloroflexota bacterium]
MANSRDDGFRVVAYVTSAVVADNIQYDKLTHINYSFLIPRENGTFEMLPNGWKLEQIIENAHKGDVKVLISVGGWGWDQQFETLAAIPESRSVFVDELVAFVQSFDLDGVDLDWEYPDPGQSSENFLALVKQLRIALPGDKLLTTAVVAYGDEHGLGIPEVSFEYFDFVNIMAYDGGDIHGTMVQFDAGLAYWRGRGLPEDKIVLGLPFYAYPDGISYYKIVGAFPEASQMDTYEYYGVQLTYNGIPTIQEKTRRAMLEAGGVMFWTLEQDDFGEYSLLSAIDRIVRGDG